MPKSREANLEDRSCSFCGQMQKDVPLMVVSNITKATMCSWCALGVVEQTFKHGLDMEKKVRALYAAKLAENEPKIEVTSKMPDKVDVAVNKALKRGFTDGG